MRRLRVHRTASCPPWKAVSPGPRQPPAPAKAPSTSLQHLNPFPHGGAHVCAEQMITQEHDHVEDSVICCPTRVFIRYTAEALMEAQVKCRAALDFTHHLLPLNHVLTGAETMTL